MKFSGICSFPNGAGVLYEADAEVKGPKLHWAVTLLAPEVFAANNLPGTHSGMADAPTVRTDAGIQAAAESQIGAWMRQTATGLNG